MPRPAGRDVVGRSDEIAEPAVSRAAKSQHDGGESTNRATMLAPEPWHFFLSTIDGGGVERRMESRRLVACRAVGGVEVERWEALAAGVTHRVGGESRA